MKCVYDPVKTPASSFMFPSGCSYLVKQCLTNKTQMSRINPYLNTNFQSDHNQVDWHEDFMQMIGMHIVL